MESSSKNNLGWLKISRGIVNHWLWEDANRLKWWLDLLLMAAYETKRVYVNTHFIEVQRGQMIASLSFLCQRWGISKPTLLAFLKLLEAEKMIERTLYHNISLLTVCNYESYQTKEQAGVDNLIDNPLDNPQTPIGLDNLIDNPTDSESASSEGGESRSLDNLIDNPLDNLLYTRKENKEYISHDNNACVREENLISEMKQNRLWQEQAICMKHRITIEQCLKYIDDFALDCKCQNKTHVNLQDIYSHFANWLRIQISESKKNESIRQGIQDKRRGNEVTASSAQDYTTTF